MGMPIGGWVMDGAKSSRARARELRHNQTEAEKELWWHLRRKLPLIGTHFRRQVGIGPYIADFAAYGLRLVIELDGSQHGEDNHRLRDEARSRFLEARGYRILRFWNAEVFHDIAGVLDTIHAAAAAKT
ncbi:Very-short-patch-repair endonuclease [Hyphomicrobiales bacterium]|nr:Very-short-patch-repair endonuclease [Hyphomicrobiales bacterium]CAH1671091.1 Very-short-patch-repair endonuclease [Hyphomicrobiales bacterium]